jgi:hypothetical protein
MFLFFYSGLCVERNKKVALGWPGVRVEHVAIESHADLRRDEARQWVNFSVPLLIPGANR